MPSGPLPRAPSRRRLLQDTGLLAVQSDGPKAVVSVAGRQRDPAGSPLRWVDLATHRSGLPRLATNTQPANPADPYADHGEAQLLAFLRSHRVEQARDSAWAYSKLGYGLLGCALGRLARSDDATLLQRRVLGPLGLRGAALQIRPASDPPALAAGHDAQARPVPHWHFDMMAPTRGRTAAVLANAAVEVKDLALHLLEPGIPAKDLSATRQAAITLAPEALEPLVGRYGLAPRFALDIRLREGRPFAQATGQREFELFASAPRRSFTRVTPLTIRFDDLPHPATLTLLQGGTTLSCTREP